MTKARTPPAMPSRRGALLLPAAGVVLGCALLASACGASAPAASVAQLGTTTTSRPAKGSNITSSSGSPLAYAQCMRAHGVPDFPDPVFHSNGGGGISISLKVGAGSDLSPSSPAFQAAQQVCQKLMPGSKGAQFSSHGPSGGASSSGNAGPSTGG
jgi:hypothetical protein